MAEFDAPPWRRANGSARRSFDSGLLDPWSYTSAPWQGAGAGRTFSQSGAVAALGGLLGIGTRETGVPVPDDTEATLRAMTPAQAVAMLSTPYRRYLPPISENIEPAGRRSPMSRCVNCGAPHGGLRGPYCNSCYKSPLILSVVSLRSSRLSWSSSRSSRDKETLAVDHFQSHGDSLRSGRRRGSHGEPFS
jgi:hypothetical protein